MYSGKFLENPENSVGLEFIIFSFLKKLENKKERKNKKKSCV